MAFMLCMLQPHTAEEIALHQIVEAAKDVYKMAANGFHVAAA